LGYYRRNQLSPDFRQRDLIRRLPELFDQPLYAASEPLEDLLSQLAGDYDDDIKRSSRVTPDTFTFNVNKEKPC